eukprot:TRINITY_DN2327_c0_g1_i1.p1 TRINITY_DN2327_c0_g1~~TRINITY_DN2327_c0_g1_i1.p1  ORF type:complete len:264 (+),score=57.90 TRINITY_DN2327_c0_g1_i1:642-1433(+)
MCFANLNVLLGKDITDELISIVGSVDKLAAMTSSNIQVLGNKRESSHGVDKFTNHHFGVIFNCEFVQNSPPDIRIKLYRDLCGKVALAARCDAYSSSNGMDDSKGNEILKKLIKKRDLLSKPPEMPEKKPRKAPIIGPKKTRGGRKLKNRKEKQKMSQLRTLQNTIKFGQATKTNGLEMESLGLVGDHGEFGSYKIEVNTQTDIVQSKNIKQHEKKFFSTTSDGISQYLENRQRKFNLDLQIKSEESLKKTPDNVLSMEWMTK